MPERIILVDSNSLIYRGYFAIPPLTTTKGELSNATFGFASILLKAIEEIKPQYIAAAFDLPQKTFRHERDATYKATRKPMPDELRPQFERCKQLLAKLIAENGAIEGVYADLTRFTPKLRENLAAHREQVFHSREMATIVTDLPVALDVQAARFRDYDRAGVLELFRDLEFRSLIPRLPPADGNLAPAKPPAARPGQLALGLDPEPTSAPAVATTVVAPEDAAAVADRLRAAPSVTVHADVDAGRHPVLLGLGLAAGDDAWYVSTISGVPAPIAAVLADETIPKTLHDP